jgi:hypothetical protein
MNAAQPHLRGTTLILEHCASFEADDDSRASAVLRLRQAIGEELSRLLLSALSGDHRRPRLRLV